jgi:hypothetical protein
MSHMNLEKYPYIILMKVGPYCGYSLDQIIDIKQKEQKKVGKYFWGYSGVFCRPNVVKNLVNYANGNRGYLFFVETKSDFKPSTFDRFGKFSVDGGIWNDLPGDVLLVGNKNRSHFAITANKLKEVDISLDLSQYCTLKGVFPNDNQRFDKYFRYRVDKACGVYVPNNNAEKKEVQVKYVSELVEPYAVYIK